MCINCYMCDIHVTLFYDKKPMLFGNFCFEFSSYVCFGRRIRVGRCQSLGIGM